MHTSKETAVIIGAGPAGLTAALELLTHTNIKPIVLEGSDFMGGISRTVRFNNNRMDIGGHRFFSKSDQILDWWLEILPLETSNPDQKISYQNKHRTIKGRIKNEDSNDDVMLIRKRKSRILYNKKFFDYPITISFHTLSNLGFVKIMKIGFSYTLSRIFPIKQEKNLEDFFINRFGKELYLTFFKSYTEKVWGKKCTEIGADWGRQRIKNLSVSKAVADSFFRIFRKKSLRQKDVETSLIEYFMYPKYGPGHLWETVAKIILEKGGEIRTGTYVQSLEHSDDEIKSVMYIDSKTKEKINLNGEHFFSTMPVNNLFNGFVEKKVPVEVLEIAQKLEFRNFITVGVLIAKQHTIDITDNWIYIHEPDVYVGRIQFFHNWSDAMVADPDTYLLGLEYFCDEGDHLWNLSDDEFKVLVSTELSKIGLVSDTEQILDIHVEKVEKAYPVYSGSYSDFNKVQDYLDSIKNLYPIGRNGMHRYNNQDHSMLTAMAAVQSIIGNYDKKDIWNINADQEYHEKK